MGVDQFKWGEGLAAVFRWLQNNKLPLTLATTIKPMKPAR
jgi:hypothetical protein